jgi:hypothetical protein
MAQTAPYPTVAAPYGLKPINLIGGQVFAGSTRLLKVTNSYATAIFYGDVVKTVAAGTVEKDVGEATATPVGIFLGCVYTNPTTLQKTYAQYWPGGVTATDIFAYVADDPDVLFKAVNVAGTTEDGNGLTVAFLGQTMVGSNAELVQNAGVTTTGNSRIGIYSAAGNTTTASLPIRIVDVVTDTANSSGNFCEFICKFNAPYPVATSVYAAGPPVTVTTTTVMTGGHQYLNPTGV